MLSTLGGRAVAGVESRVVRGDRLFLWNQQNLQGFLSLLESLFPESFLRFPSKKNEAKSLKLSEQETKKNIDWGCKKAIKLPTDPLVILRPEKNFSFLPKINKTRTKKQFRETQEQKKKLQR